MESKKKKELDALCHKFRCDLIRILHAVKTGHPGGSLSVCEILTDLYFNDANISVENFGERERDKIVLCKGHAAPMLYLNLAEKGFFEREELSQLRQIDSRLQGHPCSKETPGVELSTGPLGAGYPAALGIALSDQMDGVKAYTYAILGDGEMNEGVIWETAMNASKFQANQLITIVDWNKVQLDGTTEQIMPMGNVEEKWKAFGYHTIVVDGHNVEEISDAIQEAKKIEDRPTVILANTIKGKGVSYMEGKNIWHGGVIDDEHYEQAMKELEGVGV